jgi:membrane protein DedA with SNARE-associated domain/rhodanese-related sulfurtransferase
VTLELVSLITQYGLLVVALNVLADQIGLPVPAMPTLVVAGAMAAAGHLSIGPLFAWSVVACVAPDSLWYLVGQRYGIRVLKTLCRISLEPDSCVSQTQTRFERWGINSLLVAKFVPGLAIIAPPLAGAMRIGWLRFVALSTMGASIWVGFGLAAGALFRSQVEILLTRLGRVGDVAGVVIVAALAAYVVFKWWERRRFYRTLRMARISVADLYQLIQAGAQPAIVDVRSSTARVLEPRWIPGAIHVPPEAVGLHVGHLPRDREIVLYCTCPSEASAARIARILVSHGFKRVRPLFGGLDAWIQAGYAVETAPEPAAAAGAKLRVDDAVEVNP